MSMICGGGRFSAKLLLAILAAWLCSAQAAPPMPRSSVITFNTACARCHEGECSGRLSFLGGKEGAAGHIRRYTGPLTDSDIAVLFDLLKTMKESCAYSPIEAPVPERSWGREALQALYSPTGNGYFIPLGTLEAGRYRVILRFERETEAHLQVLTPSFAFLVDKNASAPQGVLEEEFVADAQGLYFLRLYPAGSAGLAEMKVKFQAR